MGIKKVLEVPLIYNFFQCIVGSKRRHKILIKDYIGDTEGKNVLELGCGTCDLLEYLKPKQYTGVDLSEDYICAAKKRYKNRKEASFVCADVNEFVKVCNTKFDIILMIGVIHHLNDKQVSSCFMIIRQLLNSGGIFVSLDGVYVKNMSSFEKFLLDMDRGKYVREESAYAKIHSEHWSKTQYEVRKDMMYLPFYIIVFKDEILSLKQRGSG